MQKNTLKKNIIVLSTVLFGLVGPMAVLAAGPALINLGTAGNFTILSQTGISTTGSTSITGNIGVSPAAATYITGFGLSLPAGGAYATSPLVAGYVFAPDYNSPTPAILTTAVNDMQAAYTNAAGMITPTATELGAGNIGGLSLSPGLYKWSTGVIIPNDLTLSGGANDVWVFQIGQNLTTASGTHVILSGGAQASNVFWQVAGQTTLGSGSVFNGNILDQTAIVLNTGAVLNGRALAQSAVTLDSNVVAYPAVNGMPPTTTTTTTTTTTPNTVTTTQNNSAQINLIKLQLISLIGQLIQLLQAKLAALLLLPNTGVGY